MDSADEETFSLVRAKELPSLSNEEIEEFEKDSVSYSRV